MKNSTVNDAVKDSSLALDFIFLFAICICNILLCVKVVFLRGFLSDARHCVMLSLATGMTIVVLICYSIGIHGDLYTLVSVSTARLVFKASMTLSYYLPFVYASGLASLGLDIALRRRRWSLVTKAQVMCWNLSLAVILTWFLGALVVFPLLLTNIRWTSEGNALLSWNSIDQLRALPWVAVIIPSTFSMSLAIALRLFAYRNNYSADGGRGRLYNAVTDSQTFQSFSYKRQYNPFNIQDNQQQRPQHERGNNNDLTTMERDDIEDLDLNKEINLLLVCTIIAFLCYLPLAMNAFVLTYDNIAIQDQLLITVLNMTLYYLGQSVHVILPIVWLYCYH